MNQARAPWSSLLNKEQLPWQSDRSWADVIGVNVKKVGAILLCALAFLSLGSWWRTRTLAGPGKDVRGLEHDIFNSTLGFQKLLVLNLPERSDNRDVLQLQGALTNIDFEFIDGVHGETVPDKALPPGGGQRLGRASVGSWRGHINALRHIVEQDLGSAIIFEDDIDYDVRVKQQLVDFAIGNRALAQPLQLPQGTSVYADPTFPMASDAQYQTEAFAFEDLPSTVEPKASPYGDSWDVLWLGHCGMRRPAVGMGQPFGDLARHIPKGHVVHTNDDTVPEPHYIGVFDNPGHPGFRRDFANHTRVYHNAFDGICSLAYAVSQPGARKLLYETGIRAYNDAFDIMLRQFCDGQAGHKKHVCLTAQPALFDHHRPVGQKQHNGEIRKTAVTFNIRQSARLNIQHLLKGETKFDDQYPDTAPP